MMTRTYSAAALVALGLCVFTSPAVAEKGDMRIQFGLLYEMATDDTTDGVGVTYEVDDDFGFQLSYEYMVSDLLGIEPAFTYVTHDVNIGPDVFGEIDFRALTANVNFHVVREESIDFFVGPTIGYSFFSDLDDEFFPGPPDSIQIEDDFIFGANIGIDVPFSERWSFDAALTYLAVDIEVKNAPLGELAFDPLQIKVGVSYRF